MSPNDRKLQAIKRLVALRKRMEEQAQANLRKARLDVAATEALLQTPWASQDTPERAQELQSKQAIRDVGYVRLAQQQSEADDLQVTLQSKHRELRQVESLRDHAQAQRSQHIAKRQARDADDWLRRRKDPEDT